MLRTGALPLLRTLFPEMHFVLELEVLGVNILTSGRNAMHFGEDKFAKILADTRNIAALPLPLSCKAKLSLLWFHLEEGRHAGD